MHTHDSEVPFIKLSGTYYRAIDPAYRQNALSGSRAAGRYSREDQPTLYLSASPEGVAAAMKAHRQQRSNQLEIIRLYVEVDNIFDLRDTTALEWAGIDIVDAQAPWQNIVEKGGSPSSWEVRKKLLDLGATGLIDPSRTAPGLWHLVLFSWHIGPLSKNNKQSGASITLLN